MNYISHGCSVENGYSKVYIFLSDLPQYSYFSVENNTYYIYVCIWKNILTSFNESIKCLYYFFQVVPTYSHKFVHICQLFSNCLIWNVSFCLKKEPSLRYHIPKCLDYNSALMQMLKVPRDQHYDVVTGHCSLEWVNFHKKNVYQIKMCYLQVKIC